MGRQGTSSGDKFLALCVQTLSGGAQVEPQGADPQDKQ